MSFLQKMRSVDKQISMRSMLCNTIAVLILGIALGVFSKYLDYRQAQLPPLLLRLDAAFDLHNFLGRFSIWIAIAVCISLYSNSPVRAAINVFVFFAAMVASYYWYSNFVAGFFPTRYAMLWVGFTILSPLCAFICWYARGDGYGSLVLSAMISAVFFNMTFVYGWIYFDLRSGLELLVYIWVQVMLRRSAIKDTAVMLALSLGIAVLLWLLFPYRF